MECKSFLSANHQYHLKALTPTTSVAWPHLLFIHHRTPDVGRCYLYAKLSNACT